MGAPGPRRPWPLLPLAPAVVVLLGVAVAVAIGIFGVTNLASANEDHAASLADLLAATLGARLAQLPPSERLEAMQRAARKTGAEFVVVTPSGQVVLDASLGMASQDALHHVVVERSGEAISGLGRTRFASQPLEATPTSPYLVAFVREPNASEGAPALLRALVALTTLLIGVAAGVAYAVARDASKDVDFVASRVRGMVHVRTEPTGEAIPVRTMDEVGGLTVAFNAVVDRFAAAQSSYQADRSAEHT